jgi:hypothetical protein
MMDLENRFWQSWAENLHRWGIKDWVATLLEAAGPLGLLGAQAIYLSQPLLGTLVPANHLSALARMLEEPSQVKSFATFLREGTPSETA